MSLAVRHLPVNIVPGGKLIFMNDLICDYHLWRAN